MNDISYGREAANCTVDRLSCSRGSRSTCPVGCLRGRSVELLPHSRWWAKIQLGSAVLERVASVVVSVLHRRERLVNEARVLFLDLLHKDKLPFQCNYRKHFTFLLSSLGGYVSESGFLACMPPFFSQSYKRSDYRRAESIQRTMYSYLR